MLQKPPTTRPQLSLGALYSTSWAVSLKLAGGAVLFFGVTTNPART